MNAALLNIRHRRPNSTGMGDSLEPVLQVHSKQEMELLQKGRYLCREIRSTCELEQTELGATGEMSVKVSPTTTYWLTDAAVQLSEKLGW